MNQVSRKSVTSDFQENYRLYYLHHGISFRGSNDESNLFTFDEIMKNNKKFGIILFRKNISFYKARQTTNFLKKNIMIAGGLQLLRK